MNFKNILTTSIATLLAGLGQAGAQSIATDGPPIVTPQVLPQLAPTGAVETGLAIAPALYQIDPNSSSNSVITNSGGGLVITPTFTANFVTNFGANATAAENA